MPENPSPPGSFDVKFLRKRDYKIVRELGSGACGRAVLLHDDVIDEYFVCKKFAPFSEALRRQLFDNFVREIKLLHKLHHENVVRVFNYYLYPDQFTGYILMEFVDGLDIADYVANQPEKINELFLQAISGFAYLESQGILHPDIRPANVLVRAHGVGKVIDLGFGKRIQNAEDFDKSITLNWWCATPAEFADSRYDFASEVYFVGKLFEKLISDNAISVFNYNSVLGCMVRHEPSDRTASFVEVERAIRNNQFIDFEFSDFEIKSYRAFTDALCKQLSKIENGAKYFVDPNRVLRLLEDAYRGFQLEPLVPDGQLVIRCVIDGAYYYHRDCNFSVSCVRTFIRVFKSATEEKRRLILANLQIGRAHV